MNEIIHANQHFGVPKVSKEDIVDVSNSVGITLTDKELEWVLLCYEDAQRQDPSGTWNLVVEDLAYQAVNFRKNKTAEPNRFIADGDGDDETLLNFLGE